MIARVAVILLALAGAAWLTVEARSSAAQAEIVGLAFNEDRTPTTADLVRARELRSRARTLNPDVQVDQGIGVLELLTGDRAAAVATFRRVVAAEPRNAEVWAALARAARGYDDALATAARSRSRSLAPPVTPPVR